MYSVLTSTDSPTKQATTTESPPQIGSIDNPAIAPAVTVHQENIGLMTALQLALLFRSTVT